MDSLFKEQLLSTGPRTVHCLTKFERNIGSVSPSGVFNSSIDWTLSVSWVSMDAFP